MLLIQLPTFFRVYFCCSFVFVSPRKMCCSNLTSALDSWSCYGNGKSPIMTCSVITREKSRAVLAPNSSLEHKKTNLIISSEIWRRTWEYIGMS